MAGLFRFVGTAALDDGLHAPPGRHGTAVGLLRQVKQQFRQAGDGFFIGFCDRVQFRYGRLGHGGLLHLGHPQRAVPPWERMGLGSNCPLLSMASAWRTSGLLGSKMHRPADHFGGFRAIAGALEKTGNRQVFGGSLLGMAEAFMDHGQVRSGSHVVGIQLGDTDPVLEGLFRIPGS